MVEDVDTAGHTSPCSYRKWKVEHRSLQKGDIVAVHYGKSFGKGEYRLGRELQTHPDSHNVVCTIGVSPKGAGGALAPPLRGRDEV